MTDRRMCRGPVFLLVAGALAVGSVSAHPQAGEETVDFEIEQKTLEPQSTLSVRGFTSVDSIAATIGERTQRVWAHLQEEEAQPAGPPFTRYHAVEEGRVDLEVGFPLSRPLDGDGDVEAGELPGGEVIVTVHRGPYDGLSEAGEALDRWLEENGREARGPNWEVYRVNAGTADDPSGYETDVFKPIR